MSPRDTHLLGAIFDPNSDLLVAAAHAGLSETELLDWFAQPHIQHYITTQRALRRLRHEIREECLARRTLDTLNELASIAEDPIERRRAATAILRYLMPQKRPARKQGLSPQPPSNPSGADHPGPPPSPTSPSPTPPTPSTSHPSSPASSTACSTPSWTPPPQSRGRKHAEGAPNLPITSPLAETAPKSGARSASEASSARTPSAHAALTPAAPELPTARPAAPPLLPTPPEKGPPVEPERERTPTPPSQTLYYTVAESANNTESAGIIEPTGIAGIHAAAAETPARQAQRPRQTAPPPHHPHAHSNAHPPAQPPAQPP